MFTSIILAGSNRLVSLFCSNILTRDSVSMWWCRLQVGAHFHFVIRHISCSGCVSATNTVRFFCFVILLSRGENAKPGGVELSALQWTVDRSRPDSVLVFCAWKKKKEKETLLLFQWDRTWIFWIFSFSS